MLISCPVTAPGQLICAFVFAYAKTRFCHDTAHIYFCLLHTAILIIVIIELCHGKTCYLHMGRKDADQLCCNRAADQRLCFRYVYIVQPLDFLNLEFQASSPSSVFVQNGFCRTWSETPDRFSHWGGGGLHLFEPHHEETCYAYMPTTKAMRIQVFQ